MLEFINWLLFHVVDRPDVHLALAPWVIPAIISGAQFLGGVLGRKKGGDPKDMMNPAFRQLFEQDIVPWIKNIISGGVPQYTGNLTVGPSALQDLVFTQASKIGGSFLPFMLTNLQDIVSGKRGTAGADNVLTSIAERGFTERASKIRTAAGAAGAATSDVVREIAQARTDTDLGLARARLEFLNADLNRQIEAARVGLTGVPAIMQMLGALGESQRGIDVDNLLRKYNEFREGRALMFNLITSVMGSPQTQPNVTTSKVTTPFLGSLFGSAADAGSTYLLLKSLMK